MFRQSGWTFGATAGRVAMGGPTGDTSLSITASLPDRNPNSRPIADRTRPPKSGAETARAGCRPLEAEIALPLTTFERQDLRCRAWRLDNPGPVRDRVRSGLGKA